MSAVGRLIINLDILSEDMADDLEQNGTDVPESYLALLKHYQRTAEQLHAALAELTETGAKEALEMSHLSPLSPSKRMISVLVKLVGYVLQYYAAHSKSLDILADDFSDQADEKLNLLQTRAIKAKSQFKTVAFAMGESEYNALRKRVPLPQEDWQWERLQLL